MYYESMISYFKSHYRYIAIDLLLILIAGGTEYAMGRKLWGTGGVAGFWSGDIWSEHNSQFIADPYSFTHIEHGIVLYGILSVVAKSSPVGLRLVLAIAAESGREILENSDYVINRYREETISLNYFGDSIINSLADILLCIFGFILTFRLPKKITIGLLIVTEVVLLVLIRDNLLINIIMLLYPLQSIKNWQLGKVGV